MNIATIVVILFLAIIIIPVVFVVRETLKDISRIFTEGGIETKLFPSFEEALKWLESVN